MTPEVQPRGFFFARCAGTFALMPHYNDQQASGLGWLWALPAAYRAPHAHLTAQEASLASVVLRAVDKRTGFGDPSVCEAVADVQRTYNLKADGLLGPATWAKLCRTVNGRLETSFLRIGGMRVPLHLPSDVVIEHAAADFSAVGNNRHSMNGVVLHWGGVNRFSCTNALNAARLSSHLLLEGDLDQNGMLMVTQGLDLAAVALHVSGFNRFTIGVDICRSPLLQHHKRYKAAPIIENLTGRGLKRCVGLEPGYAALLRAVIWATADVLGIVRTASPGPSEFTAEGKRSFIDYGGVVGHCNLESAKRRWDPAPWMDDLF